MGPSTFRVVLQTTPTPGVGPGELVEYGPTVVRAGWFLAGFLGVALVGWFVLTPLIARLVRQRNRNNPTIDDAVARYFRLVVLVVALFAGTSVAGYGHVIGDSAIVIAAATLALGVAGQTIIGSLVSGFVLVVDPEFNVGDYIEWDDNQGTIQSITLRVTRVLTQNGELVTVPNEQLTGQSVTRPFGRGRYRIIDRLGVAYEDDTAEAIAHLEAAAEELDEISEAPSPKAYVDEFGPDSVLLEVHYWIVDPKRADVFTVRSAYAQAVESRLEAAGITISPAPKVELQGRIEVGEH